MSDTHLSGTPRISVLQTGFCELRVRNAIGFVASKWLVLRVYYCGATSGGGLHLVFKEGEP
ncbi:MAG: hypothetical protein JGK24_18735 [Microcoleus sp. PH2017_29_MFU_D_A]|uniref:hypothetical protein n=1 Tax=unclassified Microcoleus TaxID=2642155 RepID=UPI001D35498C|nr:MULTISPECIES: hypothetical protein [unclassified Microcoleus]MCC3418818.1 hypothetical protein [Microcoleus sp. PH2017_07_MST_O_A]MCC3441783.1 hypothetical protein [Microcoleus sp. PH2017_03_ELD_O_A]MCC3465630.1 hypothetical protein [Microcoleus sp. PH2017_06_SFM_O_A]MCC3502312.1 hypothetical protein [Microcoleus sp. PH2017_19_SFW_U_A]MCC3511473.1 hypothetical protein [Microcoleus sp. PH2017_17_BER_D_A]MCC3545362.1 hypothetical protein [Microcoleus sp. PH2017_24_DOB_U_A]MCC3567496.1 hypot